MSKTTIVYDGLPKGGYSVKRDPEGGYYVVALKLGKGGGWFDRDRTFPSRKAAKAAAEAFLAAPTGEG